MGTQDKVHPLLKAFGKEDVFNEFVTMIEDGLSQMVDDKKIDATQYDSVVKIMNDRFGMDIPPYAEPDAAPTHSPQTKKESSELAEKIRNRQQQEQRNQMQVAADEEEEIDDGTGVSTAEAAQNAADLAALKHKREPNLATEHGYPDKEIEAQGQKDPNWRPEPFVEWGKKKVKTPAWAYEKPKKFRSFTHLLKKGSYKGPDWDGTPAIPEGMTYQQWQDKKDGKEPKRDDNKNNNIHNRAAAPSKERRKELKNQVNPREERTPETVKNTDGKHLGKGPSVEQVRQQPGVTKATVAPAEDDDDPFVIKAPKKAMKVAA